MHLWNPFLFFQKTALPKTSDINPGATYPSPTDPGPVTAQDNTVFPHRLRQVLRQLLEPEDRLHGNDWRMIANHLKLPYYEVKWLQEQVGTRYGPVEYVLTNWEHDHRTLEEFSQLMYDIRRHDVVNKMEDHISFHKRRPPPEKFSFRKTIKKSFRLPRRHSRHRGRANTNPMKGSDKPSMSHGPLTGTMSNHR